MVKEVAGALTQDVNVQMKNEPSRFVRAMMIKYKCLLVLTAAFLFLCYGVYKIIVSDKVSAQIFKMTDQYMNATLLCDCDCNKTLK